MARRLIPTQSGRSFQHLSGGPPVKPGFEGIVVPATTSAPSARLPRRGEKVCLMKIVMLLAAGLLGAPASAAVDCSHANWRLMFVNGPDGEPLVGERESLLAAIRRGSPVRVGWGEAAADGAWSVEEFAATTFVNIMAGRDVVAQLESAWIQSHYTDAMRAGLRLPLTEWHATIATTGRFEAVMLDRQSGAQRRRLVQRTTVHWFAFAPEPKCDTRAVGDLAPPGRANRIESDERADPSR